MSSAKDTRHVAPAAAWLYGGSPLLRSCHVGDQRWCNKHTRQEMTPGREQQQQQTVDTGRSTTTTLHYVVTGRSSPVEDQQQKDEDAQVDELTPPLHPARKQARDRSGASRGSAAHCKVGAFSRCNQPWQLGCQVPVPGRTPASIDRAGYAPNVARGKRQSSAWLAMATCAWCCRTMNRTLVCICFNQCCSARRAGSVRLLHVISSV